MNWVPLYFLFMVMFATLLSYCILGTVAEMAVSLFVSKNISFSLSKYFSDRPYLSDPDEQRLVFAASQSSVAHGSDDSSRAKSDHFDGRNVATEFGHICFGLRQFPCFNVAYLLCIYFQVMKTIYSVGMLLVQSVAEDQ